MGDETKIYLASPELTEERLPLFTLCNSVQTDARNFPQVISEPTSVFLSIQHISFFCMILFLYM